MTSFLKNVLINYPAAAIAVDRRGAVLGENPRFLQEFRVRAGAPADAATTVGVRATLADLVVECDREPLRNALQVWWRCRTPTPAGLTLRLGEEEVACRLDGCRMVFDGDESWILVRVLAQSAGSVRFAGLTRQVQALRDEVRRRRAAEDALRRQRDWLNLAQTAGRVGTFEWNATRGRIRATPAFGTILGLDPESLMIDAAEVEALFDADGALRDRVHRALVGDEPETVDVEVVAGPAAGRWIEFTFRRAVPSGGHRAARDRVLGTVRDVTARRAEQEERRALEHKILQAQKLESLGMLSGGIAHDFNNLLTSILGYADLAEAALPRDHAARSLLANAVEGARQAADLTRQLLAYSGHGNFVMREANLTTIVEQMDHLLRISIPRRCVVQYHLAEDLPAVEVDVGQVRQIVMNLILNAADAIGDRSGVIAVSTGALHCDARYLATTFPDQEIAEGLYVTLEVADTGHGMDETTMLRIFDPFFTTRFTGRGLGLAAVLGIVRAHRGAIKVYSEPDRGTTFKVLLPALAHGAVDELVPDASVAEDLVGSGLVLLADDEESIRALATVMLEKLGFEVLTATDGAEAVELYREHGDRVRVVLLDMTMPHKDGVRAFSEIRHIDPEARIVLASGYNESTVTSRFAGKGLAGFLQKPFRFRELASVLASALRDDGPTAPPEERPEPG